MFFILEIINILFDGCEIFLLAPSMGTNKSLTLLHTTKKRIGGWLLNFSMGDIPPSGSKPSLD